MKSNLEALIDRGRAQKEQEFCCDEVTECDLCGCDLQTQRFLIDGSMKPSGFSPWAYMCESCFETEGAGIGWGIGQLYEKTSDKRWLLVAGFSLEESGASTDASDAEYSLDVCDILSELKKMYSHWLKPDIVKVQIVQDIETVWLVIVQCDHLYGNENEQVINRLDLEFIIGDDSEAMFSPQSPVFENAKKFVGELCPFSLINTTDLFHEDACREIDATLNPYWSKA
ncbi:hypothetical protein ACEV8X_03295 [Vibrio parahaemolyticus]|uniref:hypothetical protein n=1 Tax=Vibrio sp. dhg TaxID=2163016 RepID=UPI000E53F1E8|nr:hypothetical protein [Vibrio sp. dhg]AXT70282.1 hypothetical protein DBX26_04275 [Vibrio sp. dhg]HCH3850174.1 hypothetical protein [Vibrio parahaemolyticus]